MHLAAAAVAGPVHCNDVVPRLRQQAARGSERVAAAAQAVEAEHWKLAGGSGRWVGVNLAVGKGEAACSRDCGWSHCYLSSVEAAPNFSSKEPVV